MKSLKDLRMTLRDRPSGSSRSASTPVVGIKHAASLRPPKQVIRAAMNYESQSPCELSFHRGDFFHVVAYKSGPRAGWIEACNPVTNARGLVPESHFEVLQRSSPTAAFNLTSRSELNPNGMPRPDQLGMMKSSAKRNSAPGRPNGTWFATVKYDFFAERSQELDAKEGDSLLIVARSDKEWLVAKPLGRLGIPGLIPIAFVMFRDTASGEPVASPNVQEILRQIPSVQEWEEKNQRFRQNAIPLGKFELSHTEQTQLTKTRDSPLPPLPPDAQSTGEAAVKAPGLMQSPQVDDHFTAVRTGGTIGSPLDSFSPTPEAKSPSSGSYDHSLTMSMYFLPSGTMSSAFVDSFHYEPNDYWYRIRVSYVSTLSSTDAPDKPQGHEVRDLILYRLYEDFIEFHMSLAQEFTDSNTSNDPSMHPGILPTLPVSLAHVDEQAASQRRADLDLYMRSLCACPEHVLRSAPLRAFLELRPGDRCKTSVSPSKQIYPSKVRASDPLNPLDFDLASQLQGLRMAQSPKRHSPTGSSSPTTSVSTRRSSIVPLGSDAPPYYRIKVTRVGDAEQILAVRMPPNFTYLSLLTKVQERLGSDIRVLQFSEQPDAPTLTNDDDLNGWMQASLSLGKKLLLFAST